MPRTADDLADGIRELVVEGREAWRARNYGRARALFEAALARAEERGDAFGQMSALHFLGNVALNERRDGDSRALHTRALALAHAERDDHGVATSLGSLALVDVAEGDLSTAARRYAEAIDAYARAGMPDAADRVRQAASDLVVRRVPLESLVDRAG